MTSEERQIIGFCLQGSEVLACVAAVPLAAWSGPAAFLVELLVGLQEVGVQVEALDLWEFSLPTRWETCLMGAPVIWDCEGGDGGAGPVCATPKSVPLLPYRKIEGKIQGVTEGPTKRFLRTMFHPDELLLLPQYAPWTLEEVEAACELVTAQHRAMLAAVKAQEQAQAAYDQRRAEVMARGCESLRRVWERTEEPLDLGRVHPGWLPYLKADLREAA